MSLWPQLYQGVAGCEPDALAAAVTLYSAPAMLDVSDGTVAAVDVSMYGLSVVEGNICGAYAAASGGGGSAGSIDTAPYFEEHGHAAFVLPRSGTLQRADAAG
eukprot:gene12426-14681_t